MIIPTAVTLTNTMYIVVYFMMKEIKTNLDFARHQYLIGEDKFLEWFEILERVKKIDYCIAVFIFVHSISVLYHFDQMFPKFSLIFRTLLRSVKPIVLLFFVL